MRHFSLWDVLKLIYLITWIEDNGNDLQAFVVRVAILNFSLNA